jgi:hypothetical protein
MAWATVRGQLTPCGGKLSSEANCAMDGVSLRTEGTARMRLLHTVYPSAH